MFIDGSLIQHIKMLRKVHSDRLYNGLWEPIQKELVPLGCSIKIKPRGGYFVWLRIPIQGDHLIDIIKQHNIQVGVGLGTLFIVNNDKPNNEEKYLIRLSFARYDTEALQLGITRLREALLIGIK